jgi:hypothetical protein
VSVWLYALRTIPIGNVTGDTLITGVPASRATVLEMLAP